MLPVDAYTEEITENISEMIPDHRVITVFTKISKPEFYIIPGIEDKLDDSKMIPVESIKEVFEKLKGEVG
jgi:hypothetical protein